MRAQPVQKDGPLFFNLFENLHMHITRTMPVNEQQSWVDRLFGGTGHVGIRYDSVPEWN